MIPEEMKLTARSRWDDLTFWLGAWSILIDKGMAGNPWTGERQDGS
jgi:hypothetical protein